MTLRPAARPGYDSTSAATFPVSAKVAGAYVDGLYSKPGTAGPRDVRKRCPKAAIVTITVIPSSGAKARCVDIEAGCYSTAQSIFKTRELLNAGVRPVMHYLSASPWSAHRRAVARAGLIDHGHDPDVVYWIADYDNDPTIPTDHTKGLPAVKAIGKQYANAPISGHHYDVTAWADYIPGVDPKPKPPKETGFTVEHHKTLVAAAKIMEERAKHLDARPLSDKAKRGIVARLRQASGDLLV